LKKAVLIVSALLLVVSGVAAVSAYEGHLVDIKAHVENAIGVDTYELDFGTVFPQDSPEIDLKYGLSNSFMSDNQVRISSLDYALFWELKPVGDHDPEPLYLDKYFQPLNPFMDVEFYSGEATDIIDLNEVHTVPAEGTAVQFATGKLGKSIPAEQGDDCYDKLHFTFYVPVFEGYYNALTDPKVDYPYMLMEGEFVTVNETMCGGEWDAEVPHADLGINLKIQVMDFHMHTATD
jgi:hypothetical protein